jgi:hypothetical protein
MVATLAGLYFPAVGLSTARLFPGPGDRQVALGVGKIGLDRERLPRTSADLARSWATTSAGRRVPREIRQRLDGYQRL